MKMVERFSYRYRCFKEEVGALISFNFVAAARQTKKNLLLQIIEVLWGWVRYGLLPKSYFNYRMYEQDAPLKKKVNSYVSDRSYFSKLGRVNLRYLTLINSKWLFHNFFAKHNIPVAKCFGYFHKNGGIWTETSDYFSYDKLPELFKTLDGQKIIFKPNRGSGGFKVEVATVNWEQDQCWLTFRDKKVTLEEYAENFKKHDYVVEGFLDQHEVLNKIYPHAVNTVRIITLNDTREVIIWGAIIKIGTRGADIDNWGKGSLCVGIDMETGRLQKGVYDIEFIKQIVPPVEVHPDTQAPIDGVTLPYWQELKQTVSKASMLVPGLPYVAWDVAITPDGPCIIEGNGRSDLSMVQAQGGLKNLQVKKWWEQYDINIS